MGYYFFLPLSLSLDQVRYSSTSPPCTHVGYYFSLSLSLSLSRPSEIFFHIPSLHPCGILFLSLSLSLSLFFDQVRYSSTSPLRSQVEYSSTPKSINWDILYINVAHSDLTLCSTLMKLPSANFIYIH